MSSILSDCPFSKVTDQIHWLCLSLLEPSTKLDTSQQGRCSKPPTLLAELLLLRLLALAQCACPLPRLCLIVPPSYHLPSLRDPTPVKSCELCPALCAAPLGRLPSFLPGLNQLHEPWSLWDFSAHM